MNEKQKFDRFEFCSAVIGWLGDFPLYQRILGCTQEEMDRLISDPSEDFENQIANKLSEMSVDELNKLAQEFNLDCEVRSLE